MSRKKSKPDIFIFAAAVILFVLETVISFEIAFRTGWDPDAVFRGAEDALLGNKEAMLGMNGYFSQYPNNLFVTGLFCLIMRLGGRIVPWLDRYFLLVMVQCLLLTLTGVAVYLVSVRIMSGRAAKLTFILYALVAGLSGWMVIPYTDSFGIIFPTVTLLFYVIYLRSGRENRIAFVVMVLASILGFFIKPTAFIVFIAVFIAECFYALKHLKDKKEKRYYFVDIIILVICFVVMLGAKSLMVNSMGYDINKEARFGVAHFFMMGMNTESTGGWSEEDMEYSAGFSTNAERDRADLQTAFSRIKDMGFKGLMDHFYKKTVKTYSDGLFGFGSIGAIYTYHERDGFLCSKLRRFYYGPQFEQTKWFDIHKRVSDNIWYAVLACGLITLLYAGWKKDDPTNRVLMLSLIGFILYELIFESHARYVFVFSPIFIISAVYGAEYVFGKIFDREKTRWPNI